MADVKEFSPYGSTGHRGGCRRVSGANSSALKTPATRMLARCGTGRSIVSRPSSRGAPAWLTHRGCEAREGHWPLVAVRGGGHSFPGLSVCDGGLVIDLWLMKGIRVDPQARTVRVQAGVLLGELDRETQEFGLAVLVRDRHAYRAGRAHLRRRDQLGTCASTDLP